MFHHDKSKGLHKKKWTVQTKVPVSFFVQFSENLFDPKNSDLLEVGARGPGARRFLVVDENVHKHYGEKIEKYFKKNKIVFALCKIHSHETRKDVDTAFFILKAMEDFKLQRTGEPLIAIGGGVLLDIAGLAATLYRRGVPYIRVPTTLLALVDASVGVKTGINHFNRRNRIGSYYAPVGAYLDRTFLTTLSEKELSNASGEILKMAVIKDKKLFELLEKHGSRLIKEKFQKSSEGLEIMHRSIHGMVEELAPNLWETEMKRLVNFGHTWSPLIEMVALPELSHGEAVALDVLFSCVLSNQRGLMNDKETERVFRVAKDLGLPTFHPLLTDMALMEEALADTVRHRNGSQKLPIPLSIGYAEFYNDVTPEEVKKTSAAMKKRTPK